MENTTSATPMSSGGVDVSTERADSRVPFGEEDSAFFPGLTKAEEVIVWAGITVGILGLGAILLRLIMPIVRKKCRKDKGDKSLKNAHLRGSAGHLMDASTPSSASRASTLSRGSNLDDLKARYSDDATSVTTISGSQSSTHNSFYGNLSSNHLAVPIYLPRVKSTGSMHTSASSQDLMHKSVSSQNLIHKSASSHDLMHKSASSQNAMHKSASSQDMMHKSASSQDMMHKSQERLNSELTQVLSTPQLERLKSLNLHDSYRNNWDRAHQSQANGAGHDVQTTAERGMAQGSPRVHRPAPQSSPRSQPELKTRF